MCVCVSDGGGGGGGLSGVDLKKKRPIMVSTHP